MQKLILFSLFSLTAVSANAATTIGLTLEASSSTSQFSGSAEGTLTDPFSYNPLDPTSALPELSFLADRSTGFHAGPGNQTLRYNVVAGSFTTVASEPTIVVDLYGRSSTSVQDRDDNFTITLYNNDFSTVVATLNGVGISDGATPHGRATFSLAEGTEFDRFEITSTANNFGIQEVRLAAVPEPSSSALLGLAGLSLTLRRRK